MKVFLFILGLVLMFFAVYPPFHLMSLAIGLILLLIGIFSKSKEKKDGH